AALDAHLGGAGVPGLARFTDDVVHGKRVSIGRARTLAQSAKAAAHEADVRNIDVAVSDVSDRAADGFAAQTVREGNERLKISAVGGGEQQALFEAKFVTRAGGFQTLAHCNGARRERGLRFRFFGVGTHRWHPGLRHRGASEGWSVLDMRILSEMNSLYVLK